MYMYTGSASAAAPGSAGRSSGGGGIAWDPLSLSLFPSLSLSIYI